MRFLKLSYWMRNRNIFVGDLGEPAPDVDGSYFPDRYFGNRYFAARYFG